jgi:hypothetical protein
MAREYFPTASRSFINAFSGTKKHIDAVNGSNSNNGNTEATAYQTIAYAQSQTSGISTAVMYVILPGTYTLTPAVLSDSTAGLSDSNLPRIFFCAPDGQVIFQWTAGAQRDAPMVNFQNAGSAVYGAVFLRNNNGKTDSYAVAMFNGTTANCQGDFYNCLFRETNANGNWSLQYDNSSVNNSTVNNCSFYTIENGAGDYSGGAGLVLNNCAFNYTYGAGSAVKNNTVINQTINATSYALSVNNSTYGVYSGTYAWGQPIVGVRFEINGSDVTSANEGQTVTIVFIGSTTGTRNYTISGVSSADINGASLTGTVNLVNNQATLNIILTSDLTSGEGNENLIVVMEDPAGNQQATLTVNDTSAILYVTPTAVSGGTVTVRLTTSNTPETNGTQIPYTISGNYITASNIGQPLTGNFTVNNNIAEFTINLGSIVSTTLTVTAYGETASCVITFNPTITVTVIEMDTYTQSEVDIKTFSVLPLSLISIADSSVSDDPEPGFVYVQTGNYLDYASTTLITQTNQGDLGKDNYIVRPMGQEFIREYWI